MESVAQNHGFHCKEHGLCRQTEMDSRVHFTAHFLGNLEDIQLLFSWTPYLSNAASKHCPFQAILKIINNTHRASGSWKVYCIVTKHTKCQICSKCVAISLDPERDMSSYKRGKKINSDGDCSHEIKRRLLLGRKVMATLDSILRSRDITLPTKVRLVKAMVFPVVVYGCES